MPRWPELPSVPSQPPASTSLSGSFSWSFAHGKWCRYNFCALQVLAAYETGLSAGLEEERRILARPFATEDREEGMKAFLEKRPPNWKGR